MNKGINLRKPRELLLCLALLLAWVEVLAAPFIACQHVHQSAGVQMAAAHTVLHADHSHHSDSGMSATNAHHDHAMMHDGHGNAAATAPPPAYFSADCDGSCSFCRGVNLPDLTTPLGALASTLLPWDIATPLLTVAAPPPADHFRPPTSV